MYPGMLVLSVILGVASAVDTLCAQAFGGKRLAEMWLFFQAGLLMCAALLPLLVAITLSAAPVLTALGQDAEIVKLSKGVLLAVATSLPPMIVSNLVMSTLRAQSITIPGFVASALAWVVSTPIVLWLAFYTPLGYVGIAMATTVSYTVKSMVVVIAMVRSDAFATSWPGWQPQAAWDLMWEMKQLAGAGMLLITFSSAGIAIFSIITGMLPEAATAVTASGIFLSALTLAMVPFNAMGAAGAIRVGNALGGGQSDRAKHIAQLVLTACFAMGVMELVVVNAAAVPFASIFTTDAAAVELGVAMIQQLSPLLVVASLACGAQGTLSAMGEQFVSAIACFVFLVVVGVPFGLWCAISLDGGIVGLWYGNVMGFGLFAAAQLVWLHRLDWEAVARNAEQRTHVNQTVSDHLKPVSVADAA
jgi:MATE family multidrug resistance protein